MKLRLVSVILAIIILAVGTLAFGCSGTDDRGRFERLLELIPADAAANVSLLEQRLAGPAELMQGLSWQERVTATEIKAEGNLLLAKIYTPMAAAWSSWYYGQDTLLLFE